MDLVINIIDGPIKLWNSFKDPIANVINGVVDWIEGKGDGELVFFLRSYLDR